MNDSELISLNDAVISLKLSRTTLYNRLKKADIQPIKIKGKAYLKQADLSLITAQTEDKPLAEEQEDYKKLELELARYQQQADHLLQENAQIKKENKQLTLLLGEERGKTHVYQEQIKQLEDQSKNKPQYWWQFWK